LVRKLEEIRNGRRTRVRSEMKRLRALVKNKFVKAYLLSIPAFFLLDLFMWGYFVTNPIEPLAIFLFIPFRASFADWMISHVMEVQDSGSAMFRGISFVLASFIYGPPLFTIFYYIRVFKPLPWYNILLIIDPSQLFFWVERRPVFNPIFALIVLMSTVFIYDFTRLILFIKLKTILLSYSPHPMVEIDKVAERVRG
jgi:hypothetical protein